MFFLYIVCFLIVYEESTLYVLDISPPSDAFCKDLLTVCGLSSEEQKFFILINYNIRFFLSWVVLLSYT